MALHNPSLSRLFLEPIAGMETKSEGLIKRLSERLRRYLEYCRGIEEMGACSDRVLSDLGIYRGDIRRLSREASYPTER